LHYKEDQYTLWLQNAYKMNIYFIILEQVTLTKLHDGHPGSHVTPLLIPWLYAVATNNKQHSLLPVYIQVVICLSFGSEISLNI
jgi:hypothetical protein